MKPLGFSAVDLMQAGIEYRPHDSWHDKPGPGERWCWHASTLAKCPREAMLRRADLDHPGSRPLDGQLTLHMGDVVHEQLAYFVQRLPIKYPHVKVILAPDDPNRRETGFYHSTLNLAAKPDALLDVNGVGLVLLDFKTEHEDAAQHREKDAIRRGSRSHVRPEHALQVTATAMVLEDNGYRPILQGNVLYVSKNSFWIGDLASNTVDLSETSILRKEVERRVRELDGAWERYTDSVIAHQGSPDHVELPERYPEGHWNCDPRGSTRKYGRVVKPGDGTGHGKYCAARYNCFRLPSRPQEGRVDRTAS